LLAVGFCDGKLQLITKLAKIEKSIEAHKGAVKLIIINKLNKGNYIEME